MQEAAFARGHGRKGEGEAGVADLLDGDLGGQLEFALAEDLEVVGIEGDAVVFFVLEAEDFGGYVLKGQQQLAVSGQQQGGVGAAELDANLGIGGSSGWVA